jgi:hypothetical protein
LIISYLGSDLQRNDNEPEAKDGRLGTRGHR